MCVGSDRGCSFEAKQPMTSPMSKRGCIVRLCWEPERMVNGCTRVHQDFAGTVHTCTFTLQIIHGLASVNSPGDKYGSPPNAICSAVSKKFSHGFSWRQTATLGSSLAACL